jgi:hypothetical protein
MLQITFSVLGFMMLSTAASANSFQFQTDLSYQWMEMRQQPQAQSADWQLRQQIYLQPVQLNTAQPLAEAAFLQRQSSLNASYVRSDVRHSVSGNMQRLHSNSWTAGADYMSAQHDFYAALNLHQPNQSADRAATAKLGYFIQQNWLLTVHMTRYSSDIVAIEPLYAVSSKKLLQLPNGNWLTVTASFINTPDNSNNGYQAEADYYLSPAWSVGLGYDWESRALLGSDGLYGLALRSQWFMSTNLALQASVRRSKQSSSAVAAEYNYQVAASYRF